MGFCQLVPNIRVNYSFSDILRAWFIGNSGKYTHFLEESLADLFQVEDVLLTSSGRSALYHLLTYLPQRKVIVPAYTCDVVVEAVLLANKEIIYTHVNRDTLNVEDLPDLDDDSIFIATHQYGFPCKIEEICSVCKDKGAIVIEDCAGALGTRINGRLAGTFGDFAIFSFNASKLINSPSTGGFLIAKRDRDIKKLKESISLTPCSFKYKAKNLIKSTAFCLDKHRFAHYWITRALRSNTRNSYIPSSSYQPNPMLLSDYAYGLYNWQAYIVLKQLKQLPKLLNKRKKLTELYKTRLVNLYQKDGFDRQDSSIRYPVYLKDRDVIKRRLREEGVEIGSGFEHFICPEGFAGERQLAQELAYLPFGSHFSTKEINYIIKKLNQEANEQGVSS